MSRFVAQPNLPIDAKMVLFGQKYAEILGDLLKNTGIEPVFVPDNPLVDPRLSGHADLSVLYIGGGKCLLAPYLMGTKLSQDLSALGMDIDYLSEQMGREYPRDAVLNVCIFGRQLVCNEKLAARQIVDFFTNKDIKLIHVRQGYARCSVCIVDESSVITADRGIAKALYAAGVDVLLISNGYVNLSGFDYGFIGGASFKISSKRIAFTGILDGHPDKAAIFDFLQRRGIEPVFLTKRPIFDIGGAVPFFEK